jgi:glycosyltransferase involved in cell wall biosynthesis
LINGKKVAVVMPAYNAEKTLEMTVRELSDVVDIKILVDDSSKDQTAALSRSLGVLTIIHDSNYGYGRNQQTCYREALAAGADIVVMVHPDYQYTPLLVPAMAGMVVSGVYDMVLASRILGGGALKGGMPLYKYIANRLLTAFQPSSKLPAIGGCYVNEKCTRLWRRWIYRQPLGQKAQGRRLLGPRS